MDDQPQNTERLKILVTSWPNLISLGRLLSVPLIVWLILSNQMLGAFISFIFAALSDVADGFAARMFKSQSVIGSYLDPLADKVLLTALYFTLGYKGLIMPWLVILTIFRDLLIIGGTLLLVVLGKKINIQPFMISKINTFLQMITVTWILFQLGLNVYFPPLITQLLFTGVAISTLLSGGAYIILWLQYLANHKDEQ